MVPEDDFLSINAGCVLCVLRPPPRNSAKTKREDGSKRKDVSYLYGDVGSFLSNNTLSRGQGKVPTKGSTGTFPQTHINSVAVRGHRQPTWNAMIYPRQEPNHHQHASSSST